METSSVNYKTLRRFPLLLSGASGETIRQMFNVAVLRMLFHLGDDLSYRGL